MSVENTSTCRHIPISSLQSLSGTYVSNCMFICVKNLVAPMVDTDTVQWETQAHMIDARKYEDWFLRTVKFSGDSFA